MQDNSGIGPSGPTQSAPPQDAAAGALEALRRRIAARIAAAGGWLPFDDFMAEALYAPGLGYYSGGRRIFGLGPASGSDFANESAIVDHLWC